MIICLFFQCQGLYCIKHDVGSVMLVVIRNLKKHAFILRVEMLILQRVWLISNAYYIVCLFFWPTLFIFFCCRWHVRIVFSISLLRRKCLSLPLGNVLSFRLLLSLYLLDLSTEIVFFFSHSLLQVVVELDRTNSAGSESDLGQWNVECHLQFHRNLHFKHRSSKSAYVSPAI